MTPDEVHQVVARLGGVVSLPELKERMSRRAVEEALAAGTLERFGRKLVGLPGVDAARVGALRCGGQVSHLSAALAHGWKVFRPPPQPTITVPRSAHVRRPDGLKVHFSPRTTLAPGTPTSPVDTVIDCARSLPVADALAVADSALRARMVTRAELTAAASASPRTGRARALALIERADGRAANPFESGLRAIALGIPGFSAAAQCPVAGVGHADVGDQALRIALEAESFEFHALREAFNYDVRRYTAMTRAGWLVARFTWDDVMHQERYVTGIITDLVALRAQRTNACSSRQDHPDPR